MNEMELRDAIKQHLEVLRAAGKTRAANALQLEIDVLGPAASKRALREAFDNALSGVTA